MKIFLTVLLILGCIIGAIIALEVLFFCLIMITSVFINTKKQSTKDNKYCRFLMNASTTIVLFLDRVHMHVTGYEKVPKDSRFLLVCNHRSNFDPITTYRVLKKFDVSFITKPENLKIPFYGKIIQKCCFLPINREDPRLAIPTINTAAEMLKSGTCSMGVYPEGTRSRKDELLPFHAAVFKIATKAKVPIVVASIYGAENIQKAFPFGKSDVYLDIIDVISAEEVSNSKSVELCNKSQAIIAENLRKYVN